MVYILDELSQTELMNLRASADQRARELLYQKEGLINKINTIKSIYKNGTKTARDRQLRNINDRTTELYQVRDHLNAYCTLLETIRDYCHQQRITLGV